MTTAEIIAIGTELLLGETIDTNTSFIARALREIGVNLFRTQAVGDNNQRIASLIQESLTRADIVITTGGLGPTVDDPTREAAALSTGRLLEYHHDLWVQISDRISRYGRIPAENQKKQAFLPQNSLVIHNPVGTAPAFILEVGNKSLICLPGVPKEMEILLQKDVLPYLHSHFGLKDVIRVRTLHVSGMGEGSIDELVADMECLSNPTVGLAAHSGIVSIRITAKSETENDAESLLDNIESQLRQRLGAHIFGMNSDTLESIVLQIAADKGLFLVTLEYQTDQALVNRVSRLNQNNYRGGIFLHQYDASWSNYLEKEMTTKSANLGLGLACLSRENQQEASIMVISPSSKEQIKIKFGGHPDNFIRWATNNALDILRQKIS